MVTRGKCLIESMVSTMKFFELIHQFHPFLDKVFGYSLNALFPGLIFGTEIGLAHRQKDLGLFLLDNKIGQHEFAQMGQSISGTSPTIDWSFTILSSLSGCVLTLPAAKVFMQPIYEAIICGGHGYDSLKESCSSDFVFVPVISDEQCSFSVYYPSEIGQFRISILYPCVLAFCHKNSFDKCDNDYTGLAIKCTAAETNPDGTIKGEVIVRASWKHEEASRNEMLAA